MVSKNPIKYYKILYDEKVPQELIGLALDSQDYAFYASRSHCNNIKAL